MHPLKTKKMDQMDYMELLIQQKKEQMNIIDNVTADTIAVGDFIKLK